MNEETSFDRKTREAQQRVVQALALPLPENEHDFGEGVFDPWELFPCLYGTYSGEYDQCAIQVLQELHSGEKLRDDLASEMFREILCTSHHCNYGSSPRVCFPTLPFKETLPLLIEKWKAWSLICWGADVLAEDDGETETGL